MTVNKKGISQLTTVNKKRFIDILRKTIEGYLDSVPSITSNTIITLLIMHVFHNSRHLQSKWMLYISHASMV